MVFSSMLRVSTGRFARLKACRGSIGDSFKANVVRALMVLLFCLAAGCQRDERSPIRIGILHSATGTMAISEQSLIDVTEMAVAEINRSGGLLGRPLETVFYDGRSDWEAFAEGAAALIHRQRVSVVFGCWTSACRKTVRPLFEAANHLLFYPLQYEGLERSPNIIYTGSIPNQQLLPAVLWAHRELGHRFYLLGSDYIFPRAANELMRQQLQALGASNFDKQLDDIARSDAEVILNAMTASATLEKRELCSAVGMNDFLAKPNQTKPSQSMSMGCGPSCKNGARLSVNSSSLSAVSIRPGFHGRYRNCYSSLVPVCDSDCR